MAARVQFYDDTIHEMARWAAKRYRFPKLHVLFRDGFRGSGYEHGSGTADFQHGQGFIELNERRTHAKLCEVLVHELAHCVALKRYHYGGHGRTFVKVANELVVGWNSHAEVLRRKGVAL